MQKKESVNLLKDMPFEITWSEGRKEKRMKKPYVNCGKQLRETIHALLESQKEKRGKRGQKANLKT